MSNNKYIHEIHNTLVLQHNNCYNLHILYFLKCKWVAFAINSFLKNSKLKKIPNRYNMKNIKYGISLRSINHIKLLNIYLGK